MNGQHTDKKYYVYELCYPNGVPFYVGKGTKNRINDHEREARIGSISAKCQAIRSIWSDGQTVVKNILFETDSENSAYEFEENYIALLRPKGLLLNVRNSCTRVCNKPMGKKKRQTVAGRPRY